MVVLVVVEWVRGEGRFFHWMTVCVCVCVKEKAERDSGRRQVGGEGDKEKSVKNVEDPWSVNLSHSGFVKISLHSLKTSRSRNRNSTLLPGVKMFGGFRVCLCTSVCAGRRLQPCETLNSNDCFNMDDLDGWMFPSGNFSQVVVLFLFTFLAAVGFWLHTVLDIKVWDG